LIAELISGMSQRSNAQSSLAPDIQPGATVEPLDFYMESGYFTTSLGGNCGDEGLGLTLSECRRAAQRRVVMRFYQAFGLPIGQWFDRAFVGGSLRKGITTSSAAGVAPVQSPAFKPVVSTLVDDASRVAGPPTDLNPASQYWRGASGRLYRHSVHTTVFCPAPQHGVYILACRDDQGHLVPLFVGAAASTAATLNLAHIRRRAVAIGATEVHLCPQIVRGSAFALRRAVRDIRRGLVSA
jgi:hypothetical protein